VAVICEGIVKGNVVQLPEGVFMPEGARVFVRVAQGGEALEDTGWAALAAEAWAEDWVDGDAGLVAKR
jgi:hypothetical protein